VPLAVSPADRAGWPAAWRDAAAWLAARQGAAVPLVALPAARAAWLVAVRRAEVARPDVAARAAWRAVLPGAVPTASKTFS